MSLCSFISGHDIWVRTVLDNGLMYAVERLSFIGASTIGDLTVYCMYILCTSQSYSPTPRPCIWHAFAMGFSYKVSHIPLHLRIVIPYFMEYKSHHGLFEQQHHFISRNELFVV